MHYMGGKHSIARDVAEVVERYRRGPLWEPFCGGLSVTVALGGNHLATDAHPGLIALYQAIQRDGWELDRLEREGVSEREYMAAKALPDDDPFKAFVGFGCSFGGKWFGGFARHKCTRNPAATAARSLRRKFASLTGARLACERFSAATGFVGTVYADPPYANTKGFSATGRFCRNSFLRDCSELASRGCVVLVSELDLPIGRVVWEKRVRCTLNVSDNKRHRAERLYLIE